MANEGREPLWGSGKERFTSAGDLGEDFYYVLDVWVRGTWEAHVVLKDGTRITARGRCDRIDIGKALAWAARDRIVMAFAPLGPDDWRNALRDFVTELRDGTVPTLLPEVRQAEALLNRLPEVLR